MDQFYETVLRLKGNMVVPGTWIFPRCAQVHAATERGLIINQHHAIPLGVNVARWPKDVPYNYHHASRNPGARVDQRGRMPTIPMQEILWSVGLRGLVRSPPTPRMDPSVQSNDQAAGRS